MFKNPKEQKYYKKYNAIKEKGLKFPAFGYDTEEAEKGISNDSMEIPGLGPINAIESFSVFTILKTALTVPPYHGGGFPSLCLIIVFGLAEPIVFLVMKSSQLLKIVVFLLVQSFSSLLC